MKQILNSWKSFCKGHGDVELDTYTDLKSQLEQIWLEYDDVVTPHQVANTLHGAPIPKSVQRRSKKLLAEIAQIEKKLGC